MKAIKFLVLYLTLAFGLEAQAQQPDSDLTKFLTRFKTFKAQFHPKVQRPMPILKPEANQSAEIPNAIRKDQGFIWDPVSKLQFYPQVGKVVDRETGYSIPFDPKAEYRVEVEAGKVYKGDVEVKPEKKIIPSGKV